MATVASAKVGAIVKLDSGKTMNLFEGDIVRNVTYKENGETKTISGSVRVLNASTKNNVATSNECPPEPYVHNHISMNSLIIDSSTAFDAELTRIPFSMIEDIETLERSGGAAVIGVGGSYKSLTDVISTLPDGGTVELLAGTYSDNITLNKSIKIVSTSGAVLTGQLSFSDSGSTPVSVELDGLVLKGNSTIVMNNIAEFTMKNCVFGDHDFTATARSIVSSGTAPLKLVVENNRFVKENEFSYNIIEVSGSLTDGSRISNNIFDANCCTHNQISLYGVEEDATIKIEDNYCVRSANMVRLGFKGDPHCVVELNDNTYVETDADPLWAGLVLIQPFGTATTTFANMTVKINRTTKPEGQLCYLYNGAKDMQFNDTNKPTVMVDGVVVTVPVANN